ncbi:hypothetical protein DYB38_001703 [Aphanomyces astaci]|uniref:Uncharacterized protein n=1 Tax=Aphanomyces astaci TaxID=112090 RepID=A0A397DSX8_APHAT|nr:hypothetical protein DYB34_003887 [Aphanomyces astaci]RHY67655.1 hypothetical protein DYB38_001703 [Aphanomyces astaci]
MTAPWLQRVYNATSGDLHRLVLQNTAAYIFEDTVNENPSVVFRATNPSLLRELTVNETINDAGEALLTVAVESNPRGLLRGDYFIDVYMPTQSLQHLYADSDHDTVVYANTLSVDVVADVSIVATGEGTIIAETATVEAHHFRLETRGAGLIQLSVFESLVAGEITLVSVDRGSIALLNGNTTTNSITAMTAGSGSVYVGDGRADSVLSTVSLFGRVYGDGDIVFVNAGQCHMGHVQSSGSGNVFANSVDCHTSTAVVIGSGDVYSKAYSVLDTEDDGNGTVFADVDGNVTVSGPYAPLPDAVPAPYYSSFVMPDHNPLSFLPEPPAGQDVHVPITSTGTTQAIFILMTVVMVVIAVVVVVVHKVKNARRRPVTNDLMFTKVSTPKDTKVLCI